MPTIQNRRATKSQWSLLNPVLAAGEVGVELGDPLKFKMGNGLTPWNQLKYFVDETLTGSGPGPSINQVAPTMAGLVRALDAGQSAALTGFGDSTGDSDGSVPASDRTISGFVRKLAEKYQTHHALMRTLNAGGTDLGPWVTMQNHPLGRRFVNITTRSLRYVPPILANSQFASGVLDVSVFVALNTLTPSAAQSFVGRTRKEVNSVLSNDLQFELFITATGHLAFHHSTDGAAFVSDRISTVPIPATVGVPIWLRATYEHAFGAAFSVNFYTSTDEVTWTKLGATVTGGSGTTPVIWPASEGSFFEIGGRAWQPVAQPFTGGKIYEVQIRDGLRGPMLAPGSVETWERYGDAATSFGGAPTLYAINASRSGSAMAYHKDPTRLKIETADYGQQALLFNNGHNESTFTGSKWIPPYEEWVTAVKGRLPNAAINVVGQNPHTSAWANEAAYGQEHVKRVFELSAAAARLGWGFVNIFQAYLDDPRGVAALITADGLHPNVDGYELSASTVAQTAGTS